MRRRGLLLYPAAAAVLAFTLAPFAWIAVSSLLPEVAILTVPPAWFGHGIVLDNYRYIFTGAVPQRYEIGGQLRKMISEEIRHVPGAALNSGIVALAVLLLNWLLGAPAAYAYARLRFPGKALTFYVITLSRLIPTVALAVPYFVIVQRLGLLDRHLALVAIHTVLTLPFTILVLALYFRTIPAAIEEAAQLDGATPLVILRRLTIPLALPSLVGAGLFAFMLSYSEFLFALLITTTAYSRTLPVTLASVASNPDVSWTLLSAGTTLAVLPVGVLLWPIWRFMVRGLVGGAVG